MVLVPGECPFTLEAIDVPDFDRTVGRAGNDFIHPDRGGNDPVVMKTSF